MEQATLQNFANATWYKVAKDRTVQLVPVFTDYNTSTSLGAMLYDKDIVASKCSNELPAQTVGDAQAWYLSMSVDDVSAVQAAGIAIPDQIETVDSLAQIRSMINKKLRPMH